MPAPKRSFFSQVHRMKTVGLVIGFSLVELARQLRFIPDRVVSRVLQKEGLSVPFAEPPQILAVEFCSPLNVLVTKHKLLVRAIQNGMVGYISNDVQFFR